MSAQHFKDLGNQAFQAKDFATAIQHFTQAIQIDPTDHVFFSNRSACFSSLQKYDQALTDAQKCVQLKPDWPRGYTRKGLAQFYLGKYSQAVSTYQKGLQLQPQNQQFKQGLQRARQKLQAPQNPFAQLFNGQNLQKLLTNPKTAGYFQQQDFIQLLGMVQQNPQMAQMVMQDPRFMDCLNVLIGGGMFGGPPGQSQPQTQPPPQTPTPPPPPASKPALSEAESLKQEGNKAFRSKQFEHALSCYDRALEIEPQQVLYINNRAAVFFAMKNYEECVKVCDQAIQTGRSTMADFVKIARAYSRKGMALEQMGMIDEAIESVKQSLLENFQDKVKFQLRDLERKKKKLDELAYINPEIAETHNQTANEEFKAGKFPQALLEYDQAIKRDPKNPKFYSNRAATLIKLMEPTRALADCDKCLELDPNYLKAYVSKGAVHFMMKEYHKATDTYQKGLKIDPNNQSLRDGYQRVMMAINTAGNDEERVRHAMADPEIQNLLKDPQIMQVLKDMQEDPRKAQGYLNDERIRSALNKLVAAGVVKMG